MHNKSKIIYSAFAIIFLGVIVYDFLNFNFQEPSFTVVYGNTIVPSDVAINYVENSRSVNKDIFSSIISDYKIINISSDKRVIIIKESFPRYYDQKNIYLSSGVRVQYKDYLNYNLLLQKVSIPKFESNGNIDISDNILNVINLLHNTDSSILNKLKIINFSSDNTLSMKFGNCQIVLLDNISKENKKHISVKIDVLNKFISQSNENIDSINHIDLRWSDRIFIKKFKG